MIACLPNAKTDILAVPHYCWHCKHNVSNMASASRLATVQSKKATERIPVSLSKRDISAMKSQSKTLRSISKSAGFVTY